MDKLKEYTIKEVSEMTGLSRTTIQKKISNGEIVSNRPNNKHLIPGTEIEKLSRKVSGRFKSEKVFEWYCLECEHKFSTGPEKTSCPKCESDSIMPENMNTNRIRAGKLVKPYKDNSYWAKMANEFLEEIAKEADK